MLATCIVGFSYAVNINATMLNANIYRITDENATAYYEDATGGGSEYAPEDFDSTTFLKDNLFGNGFSSIDPANDADPNLQ